MAHDDLHSVSRNNNTHRGGVGVLERDAENDYEAIARGCSAYSPRGVQRVAIGIFT
jgi:hypothetical protein